MATFVNPANGHRVTNSMAWLWCFLFGCFYLGYKGVWGQAILAFFLAMITVGISWLIYPFLAGGIIENHYMKSGYEKTE